AVEDISPVYAVDGSSTGTRVPYAWVLLKLPRFGTAKPSDQKMAASKKIAWTEEVSYFRFRFQITGCRGVWYAVFRIGSGSADFVFIPISPVAEHANGRQACCA